MRRKPIQLDEDGQPVETWFNAARVEDRTIDELTGLCRGVISDGMVNQAEAEFLKSWLEANIIFSEDLMLHRLHGRIKEMLRDKVLDREEREELYDLLRSFTGSDAPGKIAKNLTSTLPLDNPQPPVQFENQSFCFSGQFVYGPRRICQELTAEKGGIIKTNVSSALGYLVLGYFGSRDWMHTSYGRKIENAMNLREKKGRPIIICEDHWTQQIYNLP